jgi:hypothetical protein
MRLKITPKGEAETTAQNAVYSEEAGDLASAAVRWESLLKHKNETDEELRPWGLLAEKRLKELQEVDQREQQLREQAAQARHQAEELAAGDANESISVFATRAEMFGDYTLALERWKILRSSSGSETNARVLRMLAARKVPELDQKVPRGADLAERRRAQIKEQLDTAASLKREKPAEAQAICRDIMFLYGRAGDPEMRPLVDRAQTLLAELGQ